MGFKECETVELKSIVVDDVMMGSSDLAEADAIEAVSGHGKGRYRFEK